MTDHIRSHFGEQPWWEAFQVGDAYGAGFEMQKAEFVEANNDGLTYRRHGKVDLDAAWPHEPGMTTDDTQMTAAVWRVVRENELVLAWTPTRHDFAQAFCEEYARRPAPGYGSRTEKRLKTAAWAAREGRDAGTHLLDAGMDFLLGPLPHSPPDSCGAAMRAIPCGFASSVATLVSYAVTQARVTHHHPDSIDAAVLVALAAYDPGALSEAADFVGWPKPETWTPSEWKPWLTSGKMIAQATLGLLHRCQSLHELLIESVALCGDVDTLAALTLGIGALAPGRWKDDLPQALRDGLVQYNGC